MLLIFGGNPVFTAPADLEFGKRLAKVGMRAYWSLYEDETAELCHWNVPATHPLETWSDARGYDGTVAPVRLDFDVNINYAAVRIKNGHALGHQPQTLVLAHLLIKICQFGPSIAPKDF